MKDDGLVKPPADAINYLIANGQYAKWSAAWGSQSNAVTTSQINPPGVPLAGHRNMWEIAQSVCERDGLHRRAGSISLAVNGSIPGSAL